MKKLYRLLAFGMILIGLFAIPSVSAQGGNNNNIYFENENIAIRITGNQNVPQYQFWRPTDDLSINETTTYQVKFIKLFEFIDDDGDGIYDPEEENIVPQSTDALASLSWDFSDIITDGNNITHFNMTSQGRDYQIQFLNHFNPEDVTIKFDIVIENYSFISDNENVSLVLGFHLITVNKDMIQVQNQIQFGNDGYFECEPEAQLQHNESVQVGLSNGEEGENLMAYLAFPRFEGQLFHDPILGFRTQVFDENSLDLDDDGSSFFENIPGYTGFSLGILSLIGVFALIKKSKN